MSELLVRRALEKHLAGMASNLTVTISENQAQEAPADAAAPYQQCFLLPAEPDNQVQGMSVYRAHGIFQVTLLYPLGEGDGAAAAQAELLRTRFRRGTSLVEGGLSVLITDTPAVARAYEAGGRWTKPVYARWQAWVNTP